MISVFDYGAGNLRSVQNTLGAIGAEYELIRDAAGIQRATKLILPGVGHFGQMMRALDDLHVREALIESIRAGVPFLGICLGLQALFDIERGGPRGARPGHLSGRGEAFSGRHAHPSHGLESVGTLPVEHVCCAIRDAYVYFAHSYYCPVVPATAAVCDYMSLHRRAGTGQRLRRAVSS